MNGFNNRLRQIILLGIIILIGVLMLNHFYVFLPGVLGAITLFIISRNSYYYFTEEKNWKKGWTALLYILGYTILICIPVYFAVVLLIPKLMEVINNPVQIMVAVQTFSAKVESAIGIEILSTENIKNGLQQLASNIPALLTGTANFVTNLLMMFFVLYYMLVKGRQMEGYLNDLIPLKETNRELLGKETNIMIRANAIGIPMLAIIQGLVGTLGYYIFGIQDYGVWGFLTGVTSLIPIVGTALVWAPLMIFLLATGQMWQGIGLGIYSIAITGNIDYVARITLLRRIGDVHPLITIFGVIIGLSLFGFVGLIFGPLLISYFIVLVKIYRNEFSERSAQPIDIVEDDKPAKI